MTSSERIERLLGPGVRTCTADDLPSLGDGHTVLVFRGDFLFDAPGLFEVVLIPQMYNARRYALDTAAMPRIERLTSLKQLEFCT